MLPTVQDNLIEMCKCFRLQACSSSSGLPPAPQNTSLVVVKKLNKSTNTVRDKHPSHSMVLDG